MSGLPPADPLTELRSQIVDLRSRLADLEAAYCDRRELAGTLALAIAGRDAAVDARLRALETAPPPVATPAGWRWVLARLRARRGGR